MYVKNRSVWRGLSNLIQFRLRSWAFVDTVTNLQVLCSGEFLNEVKDHFLLKKEIAAWCSLLIGPIV
jgi:hypothetical protein